jgi:hypothetical protein
MFRMHSAKSRFDASSAFNGPVWTTLLAALLRTRPASRETNGTGTVRGELELLRWAAGESRRVSLIPPRRGGEENNDEVDRCCWLCRTRRKAAVAPKALALGPLVAFARAVYVSLLARISRFIIADLTDPSSIPKELEAIGPSLAVPVQPLLEGSARPYAMFKDYWKYEWVLPVYRYEGLEPLATLAEKVIAPAEVKVKALAERRRMIEAELSTLLGLNPVLGRAVSIVQHPPANRQTSTDKIEAALNALLEDQRRSQNGHDELRPP